MYFTEGQLREYERMMQEKPGFNHETVKTTVKKDCRHCPHFDELYLKCSKEKCIPFGD